MNDFDINTRRKTVNKTYGKSRLPGDIFKSFKIWNDIENSPNLKKNNYKQADINENNKKNLSPFSNIKLPRDYINSLVKKTSFLCKISVKQNHENSSTINNRKPFQDQENTILSILPLSSETDHSKVSKSKIIENLENHVLNKAKHFPENKTESSIIESLLSLASQSNILKFSDYISSLLSTYTITKLGEASFSEVYLMKNENSQETVLKIVPFGKKSQEKAQDILHEVRVTKRMSSINGFVKSKGFVVVKGVYPEHLITLWDRYNEIFKSENPRPDFYHEDQCFCILLLEKGGKDLEHVNVTTWKQINKIFWDIVKVLSEGEKKYEFEHRDLHWGNVLVNEISNSSQEEILSQLNLDNADFSQPCIIIIDYTLSRLRCDDHIGELTWNNFEDQEIFEGSGDYQYEIYRMMRNYINSHKKSWSEFIPCTNVFWLHYLIDKLIHSKGLVKPPIRYSKRTNSINYTDVEVERMFYERAEFISKTINPKKNQLKEKNPPEFNSAEDVLSWGIKEGLI
ncbi:hypothetical protein PCK1_000606 [Pneumocystis canis]|nr:hypothetical protein PCK1_000606 [Pneumocystis canis]